LGIKNRKTYVITKEHDIDSLNLLQFINCFDTIFFDEKPVKFIYGLFIRSQRISNVLIFQRLHYYLFKQGDNKEEILKSGQKI